MSVGAGGTGGGTVKWTLVLDATQAEAMLRSFSQQLAATGRNTQGLTQLQQGVANVGKEIKDLSAVSQKTMQQNKDLATSNTTVGKSYGAIANSQAKYGVGLTKTTTLQDKTIKSMDDLNDSGKKTGSTMQKVADGFRGNRGLIFSLTGVGTAGVEAIGMFSMLQDSQKRVSEATARLNELQKDGVTKGREYQSATNELKDAQRALGFQTRIAVLSFGDLIPFSLNILNAFVKMKGESQGLAQAMGGPSGLSGALANVGGPKGFGGLTDKIKGFLSTTGGKAGLIGLFAGAATVGALEFADALNKVVEGFTNVNQAHPKSVIAEVIQPTKEGAEQFKIMGLEAEQMTKAGVTGLDFLSDALAHTTIVITKLKAAGFIDPETGKQVIDLADKTNTLNQNTTVLTKSVADVAWDEYQAALKGTNQDLIDSTKRTYELLKAQQDLNAPIADITKADADLAMAMKKHLTTQDALSASTNKLYKQFTEGGQIIMGKLHPAIEQTTSDFLDLINKAADPANKIIKKLSAEVKSGAISQDFLSMAVANEVSQMKEANHWSDERTKIVQTLVEKALNLQIPKEQDLTEKIQKENEANQNILKSTRERVFAQKELLDVVTLMDKGVGGMSADKRAKAEGDLVKTFDIATEAGNKATQASQRLNKSYVDANSVLIDYAKALGMTGDQLDGLTAKGGENRTTLNDMNTELTEMTAKLGDVDFTKIINDQNLVKTGFMTGTTAAADFAKKLVEGRAHTIQYDAEMKRLLPTLNTDLPAGFNVTKEEADKLFQRFEDGKSMIGSFAEVMHNRLEDSIQSFTDLTNAVTGKDFKESFKGLKESLSHLGIDKGTIKDVKELMDSLRGDKATGDDAAKAINVLNTALAAGVKDGDFYSKMIEGVTEHVGSLASPTGEAAKAQALINAQFEGLPADQVAVKYQQLSGAMKILSDAQADNVIDAKEWADIQDAVAEATGKTVQPTDQAAKKTGELAKSMDEITKNNVIAKQYLVMAEDANTLKVKTDALTGASQLLVSTHNVLNGTLNVITGDLDDQMDSLDDVASSTDDVTDASDKAIKKFNTFARSIVTVGKDASSAAKDVSSLAKEINGLPSKKTVTVEYHKTITGTGLAKGGILPNSKLISAANGKVFTTNGAQTIIVGDNPGGHETIAAIPNNNPEPTLNKLLSMFTNSHTDIMESVNGGFGRGGINIHIHNPDQYGRDNVRVLKSKMAGDTYRFGPTGLRA